MYAIATREEIFSLENAPNMKIMTFYENFMYVIFLKTVFRHMNLSLERAIFNFVAHIFT